MDDETVARCSVTLLRSADFTSTLTELDPSSLTSAHVNALRAMNKVRIL
jgi:hypothetical protein